MSITQFTSNVNNHQSLPDRPNANAGYTSAQLKILYDKAATDLKTYINGTLIPALESTTAGSSGAKQIGTSPISGITENTVQAALEFLKAKADALIVTAQITDLAVTTAKLNDLAVITGKIADAAVTSLKIADANVITAKIADLNVTTNKLADSAVTTVKIANSAVTTAKIADLNVTTAKISDANVTTAKIADANVTTAKIADLNVTTSKLDDLAVTEAKIAGSAVTNGKIADNAVTAIKIADGNVTTNKVADGNITTAKLANSSVTTPIIADNAITTQKILDAQVTTEKIGANNVTTNNIANSNVTTAKIADGAVTGVKIASGAVTSDKFGTGSITGDKLADGTVTSAKIATGTLDDRYYPKATVDTLLLNNTSRIFDKEFIATAGQTVFDLSSVGTYTPGSNQVSVFINGVLQMESAYTETSSTVVTLNSGATAGQKVYFKWFNNNPVMLDSLTNPSTFLTTSLNKGTQLLSSSQATPTTPTIFGKTLVNILGNDGNCETTTQFGINGSVTLSTTQVKSGTNSFKVNATGANSYAYKDYDFSLDTTKQYVLGAWVYIESYTSGTVKLELDDKSTGTTRYSALANTSTIGSWQFVFVKIPTSNTITTSGFRLIIGQLSTPTSVAYFDSIRLYEVDSTTYNAIGSTITPTTTPSIDDVLPYVDNVKHLTNPTLVKSGKNLLPPFTQWTRHANTVVNSDYSMTLNATATYQRSYVDIPCVSSTTYTVSMNATSNAQMSVEGLDSSKTSIGILGNTNVGVFTRTITTQSNAMFLRIYIGNYTNTPGTFTFTNPQLELGSTATSFEPQNNDYLYGEATLASNIDGTVRDSLTVRDGVWRKTKNWQTDYQLDGNLTYSYWADAVGFKRVRIQGYSPNISNPTVTQYTTFSCVKFDGKILIGQGTTTSADSVAYDGSNTGFFISVADTDSGWGESYIPSATEIKAYFLGYKMNNGTFGTNYDGTGTKTWTLWNATSNTGAVTTAPTTLASGFTPYKLSYQLATPTEEIVNVEGDIALHSGTNQITLGEGVIVREKVTPFLSGSTYYINSTNSSAYLSKRASSIIAVYRNGQLDTRWTIATNGTVNGTGVASTASANFDTTAEYTVTYQALDEYALTANATAAQIVYGANVGTALSELVKQVEDINTIQDSLATKSALNDLRSDTDTTKAPIASPTFSGTVGIAPDGLLSMGSNATAWLNQVIEKLNFMGIGMSASHTFDVKDGGAILFFSQNATANSTINIRGNATTTFNSMTAVGYTITLSVIVTNGTTPYYPSTIQIDGTTQTIKWVGGTAPTGGNASSIDVYSFAIIKTANNAYTVLGSQSKFA